MLRKLLILLCLAGATGASAQKTPATAQKNTQKEDDKFDYKQMGAPMPDMLFVAYKDTVLPGADGLTSNTSATKTDQKAKKKRKKNEATEAVTYLPNQLVTAKDFRNDANLFVMMFNPTCSHCEDMTTMLEKNKDLFKNTKVVLLANNVMRPYMHKFVTELHVNDYPMLHPCLDTSGFIDKVFLYQVLPQINIYNSERKLIKTYAGEVAIDSLRKYIQ